MTRRIILIAADADTGEIINRDGTVGGKVVLNDPVAYMIWSPFSGPAQFTTDKSAPVRTAQRADYTCTLLHAASKVDLSEAVIEPIVTYEMVRAANHMTPNEFAHLDKMRWQAKHINVAIKAQMPKGGK